MRLLDQVAIVTGGGRGIGRAIALAFAKEGARVVICSRTPEELEEVAGKLEKLGGEVMGVVADVTDEALVSNLIRETLERFGRVDILINNAGVWLPGDLQDYSLTDWEMTMATNVRGVFLCTRAVFRPMKEAGGGKIINISSIRGKEGYPGMAAYCASKFAVNGLTQALAEEWRPFNIKVNAVCPGPVDTGFARGEARDGTRILPEDVADLALFLTSEEAEYITGEAIIVAK
jgi:NAD(P)-dependent dehydrogenase (short-subunit alcohol dehydrogenase family)